MVIDFHTHILPPRIKRDRDRYLGRDPCFELLYADPRARLVTAEELIATMDEEGVDLSVILNLAWCTHELCQETNDYILESVARYPRRLVGFCAIQPLAGERARAEIRRCARGGARGLGEMRSDAQGFDFGDEATMAEIVALAREHNLILLTHASEPVGHSYPGKGEIRPEALYRFITRFPQATLVCAHWGGGLPFYALMPEVGQALENVYFDTAATPYLYREQIFTQVAEIVGAGKILFGSDYPLMAQSRVITIIRSLPVSEEVKQMILGGNAQRLLGN